MAAQYYMSVNDFETMADPAHAGTSSTAGDEVELRIGDGTFLPSQSQVLYALLIFERWIRQNGLKGAGANLPSVR